MSLSLFAGLLLQTAAAPCTETASPPTELSAWGKPVDLSGVIGLMVGTATNIAMEPGDPAGFKVAPEHAPAPGTFGEMLDFNIPRAGTYRIALSKGAWIDVVRDGKALASVAHTEGPPCSGIRKIVDFDLAPGRYTLQLSGAKSTEMRVLIAPR